MKGNKMEYEEHREQVSKFFEQDDPELVGNLSEALYAMDEFGLWPDDVTVSEEQAITCWAVVEKLRKKKFPKKLVM
jgi:uncharacterized protein YeaC (DUF1315 family)